MQEAKKIEAYEVKTRLGPYEIEGFVTYSAISKPGNIQVKVYTGIGDFWAPDQAVTLELSNTNLSSKSKEALANELIRTYGSIRLPLLLDLQDQADRLGTKEQENTTNTNHMTTHMFKAAYEIVREKFPNIEFKT